MIKEYEQPEENNETDNANEPEAAYSAETEMTFSPPLSEEELKDCITTEELLEDITGYIHELFNKE